MTFLESSIFIKHSFQYQQSILVHEYVKVYLISCIFYILNLFPILPISFLSSHSCVYILCVYFILFLSWTKLPLQCSCLENPMDGGPWQAAVRGVATSQTRLSNFTFTFHFHAMEKEMATHSSVLAWRIPGTAEPGGLPSMGSHRVRHD